TMTLSFFITVIPDHDKPQPPGCLLGKLREDLFNVFLCLPHSHIATSPWGLKTKTIIQQV
ncbi:hypothetical protein POW80_25790, partial [Escherichia coli]